MRPSVLVVHLPHMRHSHPRRHRRAILRPAATTGVRPYVKAGVHSSLPVVARLGLLAFRPHLAHISRLRLASSVRSKLDRGRGRDLNPNRENLVYLVVVERRESRSTVHRRQFGVGSISSYEFKRISVVRYETCFKREKFYGIVYR